MAKSVFPKEARLRFKAARDFIKQRDVDLARSELLAIELGSSFSLFHRLMAACAFIEKDYDLASSHIEQALALDPEKQVLIADAIRVYQAKKNNARVAELAASFNIDKSDSSAELLRMALALKSISSHQKTLSLFEKALQLSPDNTRVRNQYGIALAVLGSQDAALQQWLFSLKYDPKNNLAMVCLGRLYLHQKNYLKAIESFRKVLDQDDVQAEGKKLNLIDAYICASSLSEARDLLSTVDGMEDNPRYHYLWGSLHVGSGDYSLAHASLGRCIALGRERGSEEMKQIQWTEQFSSDEEFERNYAIISPILDSIFDAFSLLSKADTMPDPQSSEATEFSYGDSL